MNINSISLQDVRQNNVQSNKNPSFKKFCGIDKEFYSKCNSDELQVLLEEAKNFANSKFCDIKYAKGPYSTSYTVAIKLKNSPILQIEPMKTKHGVCGKEHPININNIGWQTINATSCPSYLPYYLEFSDFNCPECNDYILPNIDNEIRQVHDNNKLRLEKKFQKYPYLQYACNLWNGLAFAYAYEAYWTRMEDEASKKNNLDEEFAKLMNS